MRPPDSEIILNQIQEEWSAKTQVDNQKNLKTDEKASTSEKP